jgi:hypothetical protein
VRALTHGRPAAHDLDRLRIVLPQQVEEVVLDALVHLAQLALAHPAEEAALGAVVVLGHDAAVGVVGAVDAVGLRLEVRREGHGAHRGVGHQLAVRRDADVADLEEVVARGGEHPALVARVDLPVVAVGQLADGRAAGRAHVEEVRLLVAEDLRQEDRPEALEDLHALLVQIDDVVGRLAVEVDVALAVVLDRLRRLLGPAERVDRPDEDRPAAQIDVRIDDLRGVVEQRPRRREQRLDVVQHRVEPHALVLLVDALDPLGGLLPGVAARQDALLVVQRLGAVDAGADLHLVIDEVPELLVVHQREVRHHRELELLAVRPVLHDRVLDDVLHHREVHERLAALELDREAGRGRLQRQVDRPLGGLFRHVGLHLIHVGARRVAVHARLVAPERDDHHVQVRPVVEEPLLPGNTLDRLVDVDLRANEVPRRQAIVEG